VGGWGRWAVGAWQDEWCRRTAAVCYTVSTSI